MNEHKEKPYSKNGYIDKTVHESLKMKEMFLEAVMNSSADGVLVVDPQGKIVLQNKRTIELWEIDPEVLADPDGSKQVQHVMKMTKNPEQFVAEIEHQKKHPMDITTDQLELVNGTVLDRHSAPVIGEDGKIYGRIYHFHDVTNFRKAEEQIRGLLKEKEIILREVHHRVKNYMSTLIGLLSFQALTLKDDAAINALKNAQDRVYNMMNMYERLYVSTEAKSTSTEFYFTSLIDEIISIFPNKSDVQVEKKIENFTLDANTLQTMSIIMNELLTNSMKYAFDKQQNSKIMISLSIKDDTVTLTIKDNGKGLPDTLDPLNPESGFGLLLVNTLVEQLSGKIVFDSKNGTSFSILFPKS